MQNLLNNIINFFYPSKGKDFDLISNTKKIKINKKTFYIRYISLLLLTNILTYALVPEKVVIIEKDFTHNRPKFRAKNNYEIIKIEGKIIGQIKSGDPITLYDQRNQKLIEDAYFIDSYLEPQNSSEDQSLNISGEILSFWVEIPQKQMSEIIEKNYFFQIAPKLISTTDLKMTKKLKRESYEISF